MTFWLLHLTLVSSHIAGFVWRASAFSSYVSYILFECAVQKCDVTRWTFSFHRAKITSASDIVSVTRFFFLFFFFTSLPLLAICMRAGAINSTTGPVFGFSRLLGLANDALRQRACGFTRCGELFFFFFFGYRLTFTCDQIWNFQSYIGMHEKYFPTFSKPKSCVFS